LSKWSTFCDTILSVTKRVLEDPLAMQWFAQELFNFFYKKIHSPLLGTVRETFFLVGSGVILN